jgi:dihydroneopterin aldolase
MDTIFVENLIVSGIHGVTAKEQGREQLFRIDIAAHVGCALPDGTDDVSHVLDYRILKRAAEHVVMQEHHALVETIAERIIEKLRAEGRIVHIEVSVRKVEIWGNGIPGVTIRRTIS